MRRGNANAQIEKGISSYNVEQVMRHDPRTGCVQSSYLNTRVMINTQAVFLESDPSADGLTRVFTHMSIRSNQDIPKEMPEEEYNELVPNPLIIKLERELSEKKNIYPTKF